MPSPHADGGMYCQEPPPPPYPHMSHSPQANTSNSSSGTVSQKVEGEGRLTPRQDPQGEESRQEEQQQRQQQCTYQKMRLGGAEGRPVALEVKVPPTSKRHKPQSNSMPSQSSQLIQHTVNTQQSRSLDSSTSAPLDSKAHCGQLPQYWHLPNYGNFTGATQTTGGNVATQQTHPANSAAHLIPVYNQGDDQLLPPPPEYPGNKEDVRRSYEVLDGASLHHSDFGIPQSSSHPDLSQSVTSAAGAQLPSASHQSSHYSSYKSSRLLDSKQQQDFAALATRASQMVEILSEENKGLRNELENYYKKASRLHKIECELQKVHEAHNSLVKSSVKKEGLSNAIRMRQDLNIKNLEASNHQNHEKAVVLEKTVSDQSSMLSDMSVLINKHEETIRQLTSLTSEQKETINSHQIKVQALKKELESEKSQSKLLAEELAAYRSNASATIEEESEVKMAALSQNIKETERILHEEQVEKLRYMDEAHQAYKRVAHLEAKLKALEASCAEKDAIVQVLQRRQRCNLSGRGHTSPRLPPVSQHSRRISAPSQGHSSTLPSFSMESIKTAAKDSVDNLEVQTWQV